MGIVTDLVGLDPTTRWAWFAEQDDDDQARIFSLCRGELGTTYGLWADDPAGFIRTVLGEYLWSMQERIALSVVTNRRTAVPACHAPGKSWLASRLIIWWVVTHRPEEVKVVSTARSFGQVRKILWPPIRRLVRAHQFPGHDHINQTEWQIGSEVVAYGFKPADHDEAGAQGIHSPHLLIVVDEAGGIPMILGQNLNSLMTGNARMLAIGNPPTDEEGAWFESFCNAPLVETIPIPAFATPNYTGESCPPVVAAELVDQRWVAETVELYGTDSAYYVARVLAEFPKVFATRILPVGWVEAAMEPPEERTMPLPESGWQRLGVDVADGGGDEMVVAAADGTHLSIVDRWGAADSGDQVVNAERVLDQIHRAKVRQDAAGYSDRRVRVKVDANGIGGGTADVLTRMGKEGKHDADIVHVQVSHLPLDPIKFAKQRDECWWNLRELVRENLVWLDVDERTKAQLTGPTWITNAAGKVVAETKLSMKKRGLASPDRADALCLACYEPVTIVPAQSYGHQSRAAQMPRHVGRRRH